MSIKFADLNFDKNILSAVRSEGYESPTPIQAQAIPFALDGRDIMASAQTGSGKTAAFLLPTLQRLTKRSEKPGKGPRALVLTPTRELAAQVEKNALAYAKNMRWFRTVSIVGGASFGYQTRALSKPVDLIVATPGRLMDLMQSGKVDFRPFGSADFWTKPTVCWTWALSMTSKPSSKPLRPTVRLCCSPPLGTAQWANWRAN